MAGDLARIGPPVPLRQLVAVLDGEQPAHASLLAGLVDVLELRDPAVPDACLIQAVARPWRRAGWPVPDRIAAMLATARRLTPAEVHAAACPDPATGV